MRICRTRKATNERRLFGTAQKKERLAAWGHTHTSQVQNREGTTNKRRRELSAVQVMDEGAYALTRRHSYAADRESIGSEGRPDTPGGRPERFDVTLPLPAGDIGWGVMPATGSDGRVVVLSVSSAGVCAQARDFSPTHTHCARLCGTRHVFSSSSARTSLSLSLSLSLSSPTGVARGLLEPNDVVLQINGVDIEEEVSPHAPSPYLSHSHAIFRIGAPLSLRILLF